MKTSWIINIILAIIVAGFAFKVSIQDTEIVRLRENLTQYGKTNIELNLTNKELNNLLANKDNIHTRELDSLADYYKLKMRNLKYYEKITVKETLVDTVKIQIIDTLKVNDSIYQMRFDEQIECTHISGRLLSRDNLTKLEIEKLESENKIYILKTEKKSFWDWLFRRQGKIETIIDSECGDIERIELSL